MGESFIWQDAIVSGFGDAVTYEDDGWIWHYFSPLIRFHRRRRMEVLGLAEAEDADRSLRIWLRLSMLGIMALNLAVCSSRTSFAFSGSTEVSHSKSAEVATRLSMRH